MHFEWGSKRLLRPLQKRWQQQVRPQAEHHHQRLENETQGCWIWPNKTYATAGIGGAVLLSKYS